MALLYAYGDLSTTASTSATARGVLGKRGAFRLSSVGCAVGDAGRLAACAYFRAEAAGARRRCALAPSPPGRDAPARAPSAPIAAAVKPSQRNAGLRLSTCSFSMSESEIRTLATAEETEECQQRRRGIAQRKRAVVEAANLCL